MAPHGDRQRSPPRMRASEDRSLVFCRRGRGGGGTSAGRVGHFGVRGRGRRGSDVGGGQVGGPRTRVLLGALVGVVAGFSAAGAEVVLNPVIADFRLQATIRVEVDGPRLGGIGGARRLLRPLLAFLSGPGGRIASAGGASGIRSGRRVLGRALVGRRRVPIRGAGSGCGSF